ncbi:hypothetical protein BC831DRAFT_464813 [Entophlyctis helioformis]|nr:hypothetical protein BC831DRAFT_464813 [Entophlyctis helioformis]
MVAVSELVAVGTSVLAEVSVADSVVVVVSVADSVVVGTGPSTTTRNACQLLHRSTTRANVWDGNSHLVSISQLLPLCPSGTQTLVTRPEHRLSDDGSSGSGPVSSGLL